MADNVTQGSPIEAGTAAPVAEPDFTPPATDAAPAISDEQPSEPKKKGGRRKVETVAAAASEPAPEPVAVVQPVVETEPAIELAPVAKTIAQAKAPAKAKPAPVAKPAKVLATKAIKAPAPKKPAAAPLPRTATAPRKEPSIMTKSNEITEKFTAAVKDAQEKAKAAFEKSQASFGEMGEFTKGNVEAVVESSKILATGLQEMTKGYVSESKSAFETLTAELKALTTVKTPTEFLEKQTALFKKQFDVAVATSSKNSEAVLKLANEAFQPISNRVSLAVEKIKATA